MDDVKRVGDLDILGQRLVAGSSVGSGRSGVAHCMFSRHQGRLLQ